jgi:hypothetical protein
MGVKASKRPRVGQTSRSSDYDASRFHSAECSQRFQHLKFWNFIEEHPVELAESEYPEFHQAVLRLRWNKLGNPIHKFDPSIVREFYVNALPSTGSRGTPERKTWVRGKVIDYSRDTINEFLGTPFLKEADYYHRRLTDEMHPFEDDQTARELCIEGLSFQESRTGKALRILRRALKTLSQIWMAFLLANVIPRMHVSDLTMRYCHLIYCILLKRDVDIVRVISDERHQIVQKRGDKGSLGFPALITDLCM